MSKRGDETGGKTAKCTNKITHPSSVRHIRSCWSISPSMHFKNSFFFKDQAVLLCVNWLYFCFLFFCSSSTVSVRVATVSVVAPGGLAALQFSLSGPWQEHAAPNRTWWDLGNQTGKRVFLGLDSWKKSGCKRLVWCGCFFRSRGEGGKVGKVGWKDKEWGLFRLIFTHRNTHLSCLWGPGYVKVMADGALGRRRCYGASGWLFFHVTEEISSCQWPMAGSRQVKTEI